MKPITRKYFTPLPAKRIGAGRVIVCSFPLGIASGSGWVSSRIASRVGFESVIARSEAWIAKVFWAVFGAALMPFLHPAFTRFLPLQKVCRNANKQIWLDLSQTFGLAFFFDRAVLICHDLQCHRPHRLKSWARASERFLLRRAAMVVVLSDRDATIVRRMYGIKSARILNIVPLIVPTMAPFLISFDGPITRAAFLGSMDRVENRQAVQWLVENIFPRVPALMVTIIGRPSPPDEIAHPQLVYRGFVSDLAQELSRHAVLLAPLASPAGIKIKVLEALLAQRAVLGTPSAYSGLPKPDDRAWVTSCPERWAATLSHPPHFRITSGSVSRALPAARDIDYTPWLNF
jgi:hypothetical protein